MHQVYIHNLYELSLPGLLLDRVFVFLAVIIDLATPGFFLSRARLRGARIELLDKCAAFCARVPHCDLKLGQVFARDFDHPNICRSAQKKSSGTQSRAGVEVYWYACANH